MSGEGGDLGRRRLRRSDLLLLRGRVGLALRTIRLTATHGCTPCSAVARWMLHALKVNLPGVYDIGRDDVPLVVVHRDVISLAGKRRSAAAHCCRLYCGVDTAAARDVGAARVRPPKRVPGIRAPSSTSGSSGSSLLPCPSPPIPSRSRLPCEGCVA